MIPLLLRDDKKRRAWEKQRSGGGMKGRGEEGDGGRGHVGTKRGHVLPVEEEEGRRGWARCSGRFREMGG